MGIFDIFRRGKKVKKEEEKEVSEPEIKESEYKCYLCGKPIPEGEVRVKKFNRQKYYFHRKCWKKMKKNPFKYLKEIENKQMKDSLMNQYGSF